MAIKMGVSREKIESTPVDIPDGLHDLKLTSIDTKPSKNFKTDGSVNWTFNFELIGQQKTDGQPINVKMFVSSKAAWIQNDISHGLGLPMEDDGTNVNLPGEFDGPADDPEKWQYRGPLVGRTMKAYLEKTTKDSKTYSNIKYIVCAISDCSTRFPKVQHTKNLISK